MPADQTRVAPLDAGIDGRDLPRSENERSSSPAPEPWPREMSLLSAMRNVVDAKEELRVAITKASTYAEVMQLAKLAEDVFIGYDHLSRVALAKATRIQQEPS